MHYDGSYAHIQANSGIDQGCPLSPCGFAAAIEPISRAILAETRSKLDDGAKLWAYLDDWYIWIKPQHITEAIGLISTAKRTINLKLQPHQDPNMDSILQQPNPTSFPGQSQVYTKVLGCTSTYRGRQHRQPGGTWWTSLHADCHPALPEHISHPTRTQLSRPQDADGKRLAHHVRRSRQPTRPSYDLRAEGRSGQLRQRDRALLVTACRQRRHLPIIPPPVTYGRTRGGPRGAATRCSSMDSQAINHPTLMEATDSPDLDSLFAPTPILRGQLHQLQTTLAQQMNAPSLLFKSQGAALRTHGSQKALVNTIHQTTHQQLLANLSTNPIQKAILLPQTAKNTGAHLQQPNSEAYEANDRCFQVSLARRLMLVHPAASHATNISPTCSNVSAAKRTCACPIDPHQLHCMTCKSEGGVDQRHSALARCLADLMTTHTGTKAYIEQSIPGLAQPTQPGRTEGARMGIIVELRGNTYTAIVTPFL